VKDPTLVRLVGGILALLVVASALGAVLARRARSDAARATAANLNARIRAWWLMVAVFTIAVWTGGIGSIALFALMSLLALREFVTLAPTRREDHRTLLWSFFAVTPLQYLLIAIRWYGLASSSETAIAGLARAPATSMPAGSSGIRPASVPEKSN